MFATLITLSAAAASVVAIAIPRTQAPKDWWTAGLEDYDTYHTRYVALDCISQHGSDFFNTCCHPLLKGESLSDRPAECDPTNDCDDDGDDGDDGSSSSDAPAPSSTAAPVNVAPDPTTTAKEDHTTSTEAAPSPTSSTPASKPSPTSNPSGGNVMTGSGRGTFYFQNGVAGACGQVHQDSDKIVALDSALYSGGKYCGKTVTITNTANGKTVTAAVADECPTCVSRGSIDMSHATFDSISEDSVGDIGITWKLNQ